MTVSPQDTMQEPWRSLAIDFLAFGPRCHRFMFPRVGIRDHILMNRRLVKLTVLTIPLGIVIGTACALFLWLLEHATSLRTQHGWLVWLVPVGGAFVGWLYLRFGKSVESGNNLIIEQIRSPDDGVPVRMTPLVLVGTLVTHLCGGSAGREGTAVQMGGSIASSVSQLIPKLTREDKSLLMTTGVAAGFSGVFGTPIAAMIFSIEFLKTGQWHSRAVVPGLLAAFVSDRTCHAWGIDHTHYEVASFLPATSFLPFASFEWRLLAITVVAGLSFGLASLIYTQSARVVSVLFKRYIVRPILRLVIGGFLILAMAHCIGGNDYLGLGVSSPKLESVTIVSSFHAGGAHQWSWLWKIAFTAITLGSGFKGGEVTPLFFIGATLGNSLAIIFGAPVDLIAALGFVSVFAGAAKTPLACTVMAVELFGSEHICYFATSCVVAYLVSGQIGIYSAQQQKVVQK